MQKLGVSIEALFTTSRFSTGAAYDATGTPVGTVYKNGVADALSVTVENIVTGLYKATFTPGAGAGFASGDHVSLRIAATVDSVAAEGVVWQDVLQTYLLDDLYTAVSGVAVAVWSVGTRTLTSFGSLAADAATAVWSAVARTLTAIPTGGATEANVTAVGAAVLTRAVAGDAMTLTGAYDAAKTAAPAGAAMALTGAERSAVAAALLASTVDGEAVSEVLSLVRAMAAGKTTISGNAMAVYAPNGTTLLYTITAAAGGRTVVVE